MFTGGGMELTAGQIEELLLVARRYYVDGARQADIADEIRVSRPTVSRMLLLAREAGIVRITVEHPYERTSAIEAELLDALGLQRAWVCEPVPGEDATTAVARLAATVLPTVIERDSVVGLSNGTTLAAMVDAMSSHRRTDACVVQMIGALGEQNQLIDSPDICRRLAERLGASYRAFPAPLLMRTARLASAIRRESSISVTLALGSRPDVALVGIGATDAHGSGHIFDRWMTPQIADWLAQAGAVGHVLAHHYDIRGRHVESPLCGRTVGVPIDRLHQIPLVVGVAAGTTKLRAIIGAVTGGYVNALVTDATTAKRLLQSADADARSAG